MDKNELDIKLLRKLYAHSLFIRMYGKALNEALFPDDVEEAKKVNLVGR